MGPRPHRRGDPRRGEPRLETPLRREREIARLSHRVPAEQEPNALWRLLERKRAEGRRILDLTVTNPSACGLVAFDEPARAALAASADAAGRYEPDPRGLPAAREAIAAAYAAEGLRADPGRIFLTSSTSEAYAHLFRVLGDPGDEVLIPRPSYPLLAPIAALEGIAAVPYRLAYDGRWRLDLDSMEAAAGPRTRAIVVIEPNNPTGSVLASPERRAVEEVAARHGLALIADEVFREFPWPPAERALPSWLEAPRVPTLVLGGISKSCGLPQLKLGWIAAAGPAEEVDRIATGLEWVLDLFLSVGTPVQAALPALLRSRAGFQAAARARLGASLVAWRAWCARVPGAEVLAAEGGWSAVVRVPGLGDAAERALSKHDVLLHPAHFYDWDDDRHVVASLLPDPALLEEALGRLEHGIERGPAGYHGASPSA
ncbi:MAG TPA: pyridoxal phosphate-dependent aminotransferase [Candidatus Eisenbacteria bacterium]|nr:pyridoxal phosphate-dependent aminotransferase [Candidatus Eisenbacteria bacterium]